MIIKKDYEIVKAKGERKSLALKAKKESSDEECSTSGSEHEEYAMAVRDFKKFFKRRECPKPPKDKNQRAFAGGSWSDSGEEDEEKAKDETCLGFSILEASTSGTKEIKFVKSQKETSLGGGPLNKGEPYIAEAAPEAIMGPPVCSPGSEKFISFQKSILGHRLEHIMVNKVKAPFASDNEVKQFYKPSLKPGVGFSKPNSPPLRRVNNNYPCPKTPLPKRNVGQICDNQCRVTFSEHDSEITRYTWTRFLKDKTEAFDQFEIFSKKIQKQLGCTIVSITTDHSRKFDNEVQFGEFCNADGITHNFLALRTPQSNGVVEKKNKTLQEMSRTMLNEQSLPQKF
ncbi:retrovirus-related pol polyprotein from transposon TNT 1-94 [Tanacetum coccineum]|uniref:Retrovirus-related pol polyprotein from transposon TNT 1-94 n=1 Tax=Tanacetum coccineum TaxID=301880 RepID=A0ABQ5C814_9ASTR